MLTSSSKLACCVHRVLLTTMSWIKTPLPENPTRPLKHNPQPKAVSLGQQALRGSLQLPDASYFPTPAPLPCSSGHTTFFCVLTSTSPPSAMRLPEPSCAPALPPNPLPPRSEATCPPSCWGFAQWKQEGDLSFSYKPFPHPACTTLWSGCFT